MMPKVERYFYKNKRKTQNNMGLTSDKQNHYLTSRVGGTPSHYKNKLVNLSIYLLIHLSTRIGL